MLILIIFVFRREAIAFLMQQKEGEATGALHHRDIGDIDLVWYGEMKKLGFLIL